MNKHQHQKTFLFYTIKPLSHAFHGFMMRHANLQRQKQHFCTRYSRMTNKIQDRNIPVLDFICHAAVAGAEMLLLPLEVGMPHHESMESMRKRLNGVK